MIIVQNKSRPEHHHWKIPVEDEKSCLGKKHCSHFFGGHMLIWQAKVSYFIHLAGVETQGASYWSLSQFSMFFMEHSARCESGVCETKRAKNEYWEKIH